jgi:hypothetical protein
VEKKGITSNNVDPKVLREGRDLMMPLIKKQKHPHMKEGLCTCLIQENMHITRHG